MKIETEKKGGNYLYKNKVNFDDYKQIALVLQDLQMNGCNIEKAIKEYSKKTAETFPW